MIKKIKIGVGLLLFAGIMCGLYVGCPTLFTVDLAKPLYVEANNLELTRVYSRAIPKYQAVIDQFPHSQYVSYAELGIANCDRRSGDTEKAITLYDDFIRKYGSDERASSLVRTAMSNEAETYRDLGQSEKAIAALKALIDRFPGSESALAATITIATLSKTAATQTAASDEQSVQKVIKVARLTYPDHLRNGKDGALHVELANITTQVLYDVTIQTDLTYWGGLQVLSMKPNPISVQEYWGTRKWVYKELAPGATLTVDIAVRAVKPGAFTSAMKVEATMEDAGVDEHFTTRVED